MNDSSSSRSDAWFAHITLSMAAAEAVAAGTADIPGQSSLTWSIATRRVGADTSTPSDPGVQG
jgi:hypothetical protein